MFDKWHGVLLFFFLVAGIAAVAVSSFYVPRYDQCSTDKKACEEDVASCQSTMETKEAEAAENIASCHGALETVKTTSAKVYGSWDKQVFVVYFPTTSQLLVCIAGGDFAVVDFTGEPFVLGQYQFAFVGDDNVFRITGADPKDQTDVALPQLMGVQL